MRRVGSRPSPARMRRSGGAERVASDGPGGAVPLPGPGPGPWIWPWWLHRQLDPGSPAWLPADLAGRNRTGRNWTLLGLPDGPERWLLDRRGLLAPASGRWALDWWIGAEDRWRLPSREVSTTQRLVEGGPVVETTIRVPGGEVVARHWAAPRDGGAVVVLEVDNASAAPVALALALRPVGPAGPTGTRRISLDGDRLLADGETVLRAPVLPRQAAFSTGAHGDVAATVIANSARPAVDTTVECPAGWAGAALIWPLAHRATLRVELGSGGQRPAAPGPGPAPGAGEVARGWTARVGRATRLELPEGPLASSLEAQRRYLLLAGPHDVPGGDGRRGECRRGAARVVAALATAGLREEAAVRLDTWMGGQHRSGRLGGGPVDTAATLWALGVWSGTGADDGLLARSPLGVTRAAELIARSAPAAGPAGAAWSVAGLRAATRLLLRLDEPEAARRVRAWADERSDRLPEALTPLQVSDGVDERVAAALLAVGLGVLPAGHAAARAARTLARRSFAGVPHRRRGRSLAVGGAPPGPRPRPGHLLGPRRRGPVRGPPVGALRRIIHVDVARRGRSPSRDRESRIRSRPGGGGGAVDRRPRHPRG